MGAQGRDSQIRLCVAIEISHHDATWFERGGVTGSTGETAVGITEEDSNKVPLQAGKSEVGMPLAAAAGSITAPLKASNVRLNQLSFIATPPLNNFCHNG